MNSLASVYVRLATAVTKDFDSSLLLLLLKYCSKYT